MKMKWLVFCALILMLSLMTNGYAHEEKADYAIETDEIQYEESPINKLNRGIINTATCWAEIPAQVFKVSKEKDPFLGVTIGVVEGTFTGILRGLTGIVDALTFIAPPYDEPLMKPEYALQSADEKIKEYLW